jgi:circadian clock protein KaiB
MPHLVMRLYVAGDGPNSVAARANLRRLLAPYDPSEHSLEVVDCLRDPSRVLREGVLVTPTLVRLEPTPVRTIVGSLSDGAQVLEALGLATPVAPIASGGVRA